MNETCNIALLAIIDSNIRSCFIFIANSRLADIWLLVVVDDGNICFKTWASDAYSAQRGSALSVP